MVRQLWAAYLLVTQVHQPLGGFGLTAAGINDDLSDTDELVSIGSKAEWINDRWTVTADFTYSRAESAFANEVSASLPLSSLDGGEPGNPCCNNLTATPTLSDQLVIDLVTNGTSLPNLNISTGFHKCWRSVPGAFWCVPNR